MENDWIYYTIVPDIILLIIGGIIVLTGYTQSDNINNKKRK